MGRILVWSWSGAGMLAVSVALGFGVVMLICGAEWIWKFHLRRKTDALRSEARVFPGHRARHVSVSRQIYDWSGPSAKPGKCVRHPVFRRSDHKELSVRSYTTPVLKLIMLDPL